MMGANGLKFVAKCRQLRREFASFAGRAESSCEITDYFATVTLSSPRSSKRPLDICQHRYPSPSQPVFTQDRLTTSFGAAKTITYTQWNVALALGLCGVFGIEGSI